MVGLPSGRPRYRNLIDRNIKVSRQFGPEYSTEVFARLEREYYLIVLHRLGYAPGNTPRREVPNQRRTRGPFSKIACGSGCTSGIGAETPVCVVRRGGI